MTLTPRAAAHAASCPFVASALALAAGLGTLPTAGAGEVEFAFYRFTPTLLRDDAAANSVQLAEFELLLGGVPLDLSLAFAENPGGNNPAAEQPLNAIDTFTDTKWLDFNKGALVIDLGEVGRIDGYRFVTANDATERDPISWAFEGSDDGFTWSVLDVQSDQDFEVPLERFAATPDYAIPDIPAPNITAFAASPGSVEAGQETTLIWVVDGADQVVITPEPGAVDPAMGSAVVEPDGATVYTLSATSAGGTTTASITVLEVERTDHTYQFFRFTPTELRDDNAANSVQLAEFELLSDGLAVDMASAFVESSPPGDHPGGESPFEVADGFVDTKWLDFLKGGLVFDFGAPVTVNGYRLATANDAPERDPISWTLEGSDDGATWAALDLQDFFPLPTSRFTYTEEIPLGDELLPPLVRTFTATPQVLLAGDPVTLTWETASATTATITPGIGAVELSGTLTFDATTPVVYTLTATSAIGTTTATVSVDPVVNPGPVTFSMFRFTPLELRDDANANSVQISEIEFLSEGIAVDTLAADATNPDGDNPDGEGPLNAIDTFPDTKWLDFFRGPLVVDFGAPTTIDAYRLASANDAPGRDPISWLFEGSDDGTTWTLIDERSGFDFPVDRFTYTVEIPFSGDGGGGGPATGPFRVLSIARDTVTSEVTLRWKSEADKSYGVEGTETLTGWTEIDGLDGIPSQGDETQVQFFPDNPAVQYFRVTEQN